MAYSDFTLKKVKLDFELELIENAPLFSDIPEAAASARLLELLRRNAPLALAINTEKARSELIIVNILLEVRERLDDGVSLFSGIDFNVDKDKGLTGYCDYLIGGSPEQLYLDIPVIAIVEAKNENLVAGLGQCLAEMYAARLFNEREGHPTPCVYGAVTTGDEWKFLKLMGDAAHIDRDAYYLNQLPKILGILLGMAGQAA
jgi:hypothetical protein